MRRLILSGSFIALAGLLCVLWAWRFERVPGLPTWRLADLRTGAPPIPGLEWAGPAERLVLRLRVGPAHPQVSARLAISGVPAVEGLHLRFRMTSRGLAAGARDWEDGRCAVEWHAPDGRSLLETHVIGSIRDDIAGEPQDFVLLSRCGNAIPTLRLEHLGRAGEFDLSDLEITPVRERGLWKSGKWLLAAGWLAWGAAFILSWPGVRGWRAVCASAIWLVVCVHFVIPGPWMVQRPIYPDFRIAPEPAATSPAQSVATAEERPGISSAALPSLGKVPDHGSLILQIKIRIARARPLLHLLLLFGPSLVLAWLVGRKPALPLLVGLALAIELAQIAFGYGFDWIDVTDLACDAAGIALGLWLAARLPRGAAVSSPG